MAQRTILYPKHVEAGARLVDFAGWELPVMYTSIVEEHNKTRNAVSLFDVSHMGEFVVKGEHATDFISKMIPTRLNKIVPGSSMYSILCNENGGVIDDIFIYMVSVSEYYIVVNASRISDDFAWLQQHLIPGVELIDLSADTAKIDVQGPLSRDLVREVFEFNELTDLKRFHFMDFPYNSDSIRISYSGYTGEAGFELYIPNAHAPEVWQILLDKGERYGIIPAGLGARDSLRLESGLSLYGHELTESISPVQAHLQWLISSEEDYIGKSALLNEISRGPEKTLLPFIVEGRGIPRDGYDAYLNQKKIGYITSGVFSPTLKKGIGFALVNNGLLNENDTFDIMIRNNFVSARVTKRPFYTYKG